MTNRFLRIVFVILLFITNLYSQTGFTISSYSDGDSRIGVIVDTAYITTGRLNVSLKNTTSAFLLINVYSNSEGTLTDAYVSDPAKSILTDNMFYPYDSKDFSTPITDRTVISIEVYYPHWLGDITDDVEPGRKLNKTKVFLANTIEALSLGTLSELRLDKVIEKELLNQLFGRTIVNSSIQFGLHLRDGDITTALMDIVTTANKPEIRIQIAAELAPKFGISIAEMNLKLSNLLDGIGLVYYLGTSLIRLYDRITVSSYQSTYIRAEKIDPGLFIHSISLPSEVAIGDTVYFEFEIKNNSRYARYNVQLDLQIIAPPGESGIANGHVEGLRLTVEDARFPLRLPFTSQNATISPGATAAYRCKYIFKTSSWGHQYSPGYYSFNYGLWFDPEEELGSISYPTLQSSLVLKVYYPDQPPQPPQNLQAFSSSNRIVLKWIDSNDPKVSTYRVYRSQQQTNEGIQVGSVNAPATMFVDTTVTSGVYFYRVKAVNNKGVESASSNVATINILSLKPSLSDGTISPLNGNINSTFTWSVIYNDSTGTTPDEAIIFIDGNRYSMNQMSRSTGKHRKYTFIKSYLSNGNHSFYFLFRKGTDTLRFPPLGSLEGPGVAGIGEVLSEGAVSPDTGRENTSFTYSVKYISLNGKEPDSSLIILDGITQLMTKGSGNASSGIQYTFSKTGLGPGKHSFYFYFHQNSAWYRYPKVGTIESPYVGMNEGLIVTTVPDSLMYDIGALPSFQIQVKDSAGKLVDTDEIWIWRFPGDSYRTRGYNKISTGTYRFNEYLSGMAPGNNYYIVTAFKNNARTSGTSILNLQAGRNIDARIKLSSVNFSIDTSSVPIKGILSYNLSDSAYVTIEIQNQPGNTVRHLLMNEPRMAGRHTELWDGTDDGTNYLSVVKYSAKIKVINQSKLEMQFPFGRWGTGTGETDGVTGIAINPTRRLVYCAVGGSSQANSRIVVYDFQGTLVKTFSGTGSGTAPGQLYGPLAICVDKNNDIYLLDPAFDGRVQKFNQDFVYINQITNVSSGTDWPYGGAITVDPLGKIFVGYRNNIRVYNSSLIEQYSFSSKKPDEIDDKLVSGIAVDGTGNILVIIRPGTLRKFSSNGSFLADYSVSNSQYGAEIAISAGKLMYIKSSTFLTIWDISGREILRQSAPSYQTYSIGIASDDFGNIFCTGGTSGFNLGETELAKFTDVYSMDSCTTALVGGSVTDVNRELMNISATYSLSQNYPNPFNPMTRIRFELPIASFVSLRIYNILGQEVAVLVNDQRAPGRYEVEFNASKLASGVYFYRLIANDYVTTKKFLLLK